MPASANHIQDMARAHTLMQAGVAQGVFPGGVLWVQVAGQSVFHKAYGLADIYSQTPMTTDTVFDLASLTKALATAPAMMHLFDAGRLAPGDTLGDMLPLFKGTDKQGITIDQLLCHTAGLPAHRKYYTVLAECPENMRRAHLLELLAAEPLIAAPGQTVLYSDLGFMVLRGIIEAVSEERLDQFIRRVLYEPLDLSNLFFIDLFSGSARPEAKTRQQIAATENCPRRKRLLKGAVHDDNAYETGGIDGQAGLFGTTAAVGALLNEFLAAYHGEPNHGLLSKSAMAGMLEEQSQTRRTWGFDMPSATGSSAGKFFPADSVGHLGFTGTSFWVDVKRRIAVLLFTNRIHPDRNNEAIRAFRPKLHDAVMGIF